MRKPTLELQGAAVLVTGAAGFIGFHVSRALLAQGVRVTGLDNLNDYYDPALKRARLGLLEREPGFAFVQADLADAAAVNAAFAACRPAAVVHLAAQAGVRYSIENPRAYIESNVVGFFNVLEACRHSGEIAGAPVRHLLYASSSSVYGNRREGPFSVEDDVSRPVSLYAATKKSDELMAYTYAHLYGIPATGLRFFTVYGPWGRPDMAYYSFTEKIFAGEPIRVFNHGDMLRDFTYIDDIVAFVLRVLACPPEGEDPARLYNIGNSHPERLSDFIAALEQALGREAQKEYLPMQPGDVYQTSADVGPLERDFGFRPDTPIAEGLSRFAAWYRGYTGRTGG